MNWRTLVLFSVCALLVVAGYALLSKRDDTVNTVAATVSQPGFYMKEAVITDVNKDGKPRFTLTAANIAQDETHQHIKLDQVMLNYLGASRTPWQLQASTGDLQPDQRIVTFTGEVTLQPTGSRVTAPVVLTTNELMVDTERNMARAPGKVVITMNKHVLSAVGMQANLQRQTIRLESQVHGEFASH